MHKLLEIEIVEIKMHKDNKRRVGDQTHASPSN